MTTEEELAWYKEQYTSAYNSLFKFSSMDTPLSQVASRAETWIAEHDVEKHKWGYRRDPRPFALSVKKWHQKALACESLPEAIRLMLIEEKVIE